MLSSLADLLAAVDLLYGAAIPLKPLQMLAGIRRVNAGEGIKAVAKSIGTTAKKLESVNDAADPITEAIKCSLADAEDAKLLGRVRRNLGQLLVGQLAEHEFERIYRESMATSELHLEDDREARSDTDYLVRNGSQRALFRVNIKFFGSQFRNAKELVGLEPDDCFALATYKIKQGLDKQEKEVLPYLFVIVSVPGLMGERAGEAIPENLCHLCSLIFKGKVSGKRGVEDAIIEKIAASPPPASKVAIEKFAQEIAAASWYVLSARKADKLLREKLFDRVYAVRVRAFARNYGNAELDMHFSLKDDLTPLKDFLAKLRELGLPQIMSHLERGIF